MKLVIPDLGAVSVETRKRIETNSRERYMEVFGFEVANLERIAHIATSFPIYKSLPAFMIEE